VNCKYCGGALIWDYERGEIVCAKCGVVADHLTTLEAGEFRTKHLELDSGLNTKRSRRVREVVSREYKHALKLYEKCVKISRERPWFEVDYDKVLKTGKFVHAIKSKASIEARRNLESMGYLQVLRKGLELISAVNPAFLARSERGRYALAYMLLKKLETGIKPSSEEVIRIFNISLASYRRLCVVVDRILSQMKSIDVRV